MHNKVVKGHKYMSICSNLFKKKMVMSVIIFLFDRKKIIYFMQLGYS